MNKAWKVLPQKSNDLITQLLINRNINTKEREKFFNPKLIYFEKEFRIPGIAEATAKIKKVIESGGLIIVYGDYDVDGICACAVMYKALTSLGGKVLPYIPHREKEGYGLSEVGLNYAKDQGAVLVITVDHGIGAIKMARYAKKLGLELIITDHHTLGSKKPDALAIVHSTKMCGTAVAWCLVKNLVSETLAMELLEFVALATVCDLIPLRGVNRAFVREGLALINRTHNLGLQALIKESGIEGEITSYALGHYLGPRLNAIGRLEHAMDALRLLCTKDQTKAKKLARILTDANVKRQELTQVALEEARLLVDSEKSVYVLSSKKWIPGIIGLIAGRIAEETGRPSIAISMGQVISKGSARSVDGLNIVEVIRQADDLLIDAGGHKGAAGFSIETKKIEQFRIYLSKLLEKQKYQEKVLEIEAIFPSKKLTKKLAQDLLDFEPFGLDNPPPLLATKRMVISDIRAVGNGKHLKFQADGIDAIAFGAGERKEELKSGGVVDLAYYLEINRFNGSEILQLKIKDIRSI